MKLLLILLLASLVVCKKPTVYLIRHAEKPTNGSRGLSTEGLARAQCLREVFGKTSDYNIGFIVAQKHKNMRKFIGSEACGVMITDVGGPLKRPYFTVEPLAKDLKLKIHDTCPREIPGCVVDAVYNYLGDGNVLICWEDKMLTRVAEALGVRRAGRYPSDRFDIIWTLSRNRKHIKNVTSQQCPGLDF